MLASRQGLEINEAKRTAWSVFFKILIGFMRELQAFYLGKRRVEMVTSHEVYRAAAAAAAQLQWPGKKNVIHSLLASF